MSHVPHELSEDFADQQDQIDRMAEKDPVFAAIAKEYDSLNLRVHQADSYEKPMNDLAEHQLKKRRMFLKDEISRRLAEA
jgi:uncharacterized protein YdcH (DUF465 family)